MAWAEIHQELPRHPKTKRLESTLGVINAQAVGHLVLMWLWALDFASDGDLSAMEEEIIASAAGWPGDAHVFVDALTKAEWIDSDGRIHDWLEYAGRLVSMRERNKLRKQAQRSKKDKPQTGTQEEAPQRTAQPVELPPGFPDTEKEACEAAAIVGCAPEFAAEEWNLAMSRGGRDHKGLQITSWAHHLRTRHTWSIGRKHEHQHRNGSGSKRIHGNSARSEAMGDLGGWRSGFDADTDAATRAGRAGPGPAS